MNRLWILCFTLFVAGAGYAEESAESSSVGPEKAVREAHPERGIRLSDAAVKRLGIQITPVRSLPLRLARSSVVISREETGVYRVRDGWYQRIHGEIRPLSGAQVEFQPEHPGDLRLGDSIVTESVGLLRVAELAAFEGGDGHTH